MAASLLSRINTALRRIELTVEFALGRRYPPAPPCLVGVETEGDRFSPRPPSPFSLKDVLGEGFLWAVPKSRRTIEKRLKRKFGHPDYVWKMIKPKTYLKTCNVCGDDHEAGVLCPTCYKKVMDETKAMQETIQEKLELEPVEKEVVVLYEGEKDANPDEFYEGKRIVEMKKARPAWFSKNLLQQTTQKPATSSDVKPSDLG